jgi:glutamate/aspartate transport system substrate-binding protein
MDKRTQSPWQGLVFLLLAALLAPPAAAQATFDKVKSRSQLVVGYRDNAFPFSFTDGSTPGGYSLDLCAPIVERMVQASGARNVRVVYQAVEPERLVRQLQSGAIDLMCANTSDTAARRKLVAFSPPIFYATVRVMVRSRDKPASLDQLAGTSLVVLGGTTAKGALAAYASSRGLNWKIANVLEHDAAMSQLRLGQAGGYARDDVLLMDVMRKEKDPAEFSLLPERLSSEPIAIAYRRGDAALQKLVDMSVVEAMRSGSFSQVYDKWFTRPVPPSGQALQLPMSSELSALVAAAR